MDRNGLKYIHISEASSDILKYIDGRRKGEFKSLKTPWEKFNDACMGGIEWQTITTIAGVSGSGKTAIVNQLETALFDLNPEEKFSILSLNFEMLSKKLIGRKISHDLKLTTTELYSAVKNVNISDDTFEEAVKVTQRLNNYDIYYVETPGSVEQIKATILSFALSKRNENPNAGVVVMLDHLLLVNGKDGDLERKILFDLMLMFNNLKKSLKISFILLSQLNRDIESSERLENPELHFPRKKDIFGADSIYQFSDVVLISHRPELLGINYYGPYKWQTKDVIFFHFIKMREGEPFIAKMRNNLKYNEVLDWID